MTRITGKPRTRRRAAPARPASFRGDVSKPLASNTKPPGNEHGAKPGQLASIQHLRFLAAAAVLYGHTVYEAGERFFVDRSAHQFPRLIDWGIGVDLFFVISGFVIFLSSSARFGEKGFAGVFLWRRMERVAPLYWIFTTLMMAAALIMPGAITHDGFDPAHIASSYLFVPWPRADEQLRPLLALGWTLNYEMFFYAIFAACLLLPKRWGPVALPTLLISGVAFHPIIPETWWIAHFWTDPFVLEFLTGIGLAKLYQSGVRLPRAVALIGVIAAVALAILFTRLKLEDAVLRSGLPAAFFAAFWILGPGFIPAGRLSRLLNFGGESSYALYLSHPFVLNIAALAWTKLSLPAAPPLFVVACCGAALIVGAAVHVMLERPLTAWLRNRSAAPKVLRPAWQHVRAEGRKAGAWIGLAVAEATFRLASASGHNREHGATSRRTNYTPQAGRRSSLEEQPLKAFRHNRSSAPKVRLPVWRHVQEDGKKAGAWIGMAVADATSRFKGTRNRAHGASSFRDNYTSQTGRRFSLEEQIGRLMRRLRHTEQCAGAFP